MALARLPGISLRYDPVGGGADFVLEGKRRGVVEVGWGDKGDRGLFKTVDGGVTWRKLQQGLPADRRAGATDLVMDPSSPNVLYVAFYQRLNCETLVVVFRVRWIQLLEIKVLILERVSELMCEGDPLIHAQVRCLANERHMLRT